MKKLLLLAVALLMWVPMLSGSAAAVDIFNNVCGGAGSSTDVCNSVNLQKATGGDPIINVIKVTLNLLSIAVGAAAIILLIIAGIRFITANGDANGIKEARETIIYVAVGILVTVLSQTIVIFVLDRLK